MSTGNHFHVCLGRGEVDVMVPPLGLMHPSEFRTVFPAFSPPGNQVRSFPPLIQRERNSLWQENGDTSFPFCCTGPRKATGLSSAKPIPSWPPGTESARWHEHHPKMSRGQWPPLQTNILNIENLREKEMCLIRTQKIFFSPDLTSYQIIRCRLILLCQCTSFGLHFWGLSTGKLF